MVWKRRRRREKKGDIGGLEVVLCCRLWSLKVSKSVPLTVPKVTDSAIWGRRR